MDTEKLMKIAGYLFSDNRLKPDKDIQKMMAEDQEARELLLLSDLPGIRQEVLFAPPFDIPALMVTGVSNGYFQILHYHDITHDALTYRFIEAIKRITDVSLPVCIRKKMGVSYPLPPLTKPTHFKFDQTPEGIKLMIEPPMGEENYLELWHGSVLMRAMPLSSLANRVLSIPSGEEPLAIRVKSAESGAAFIFTQWEFSRQSWKSACLFNALTGNINEALRILREELFPDSKSPSCLQPVFSIIETIKAVTRSEALTLIPVPLLRSTTFNREDRLVVYRMIWKGILRCWPSAEDYPNPFNESDQNRTLPHLSSSVQELLNAVIDMVEGRHPHHDLPIKGPDPTVMAGWAALSGWRYIMERDFQRAYDAFAAVEPGEVDPFGLRTGRMVAQHLLSCSAGKITNENIVMSDQIWKEVFFPIFNTDPIQSTQVE